MRLGPVVDSPRYFEGLCSPGMDPNELGPVVLAHLIPRHFPDMNALHRASGIAYSTIHAWKKKTTIPRWDQIVRLADLTGMDPTALVSSGASQSLSALRNHPDFDAARSAAMRRFPAMPTVAYELAGDMSAAQWPEHLDEHVLYRLAEFWFAHASDHRLIEAETEAVRREMAEEDAKRRR